MSRIIYTHLCGCIYIHIYIYIYTAAHVLAEGQKALSNDVSKASNISKVQGTCVSILVFLALALLTLHACDGGGAEEACMYSYMNYT
jgi:hypothetical protein